MKYLTYLFAFLLILTSVSATCYNQNNLPFCSKDDPTCVAPSDFDTDADGWSDSCDAFIDNEYLWVDYDGDDIGYGTLIYDCNDIDETITTYCGNTSLLEEPITVSEEPSNNITSTNSTQTNTTSTNPTSIQEQEETPEKSTRKGRSHSGTTIYVSDPNDNFVEEIEPVNSPATDESLVEETFPQKEIVPLVQPLPKDEGNSITGAVLGTSNSINLWPLWFLIMIIGLLLFVARINKNN